MALLKFPDDTRNPIECADWMELQVLLSPERRCSVAAVERNIKRLSLSDEKRAIQQIAETETASSEVLGEIKRRQQAATAAYPFSLSGTELILSGDIKDFAAYIFCLCLSRFGWKHRKGGKTFPRRMFEDL